MNNKLFCVLIVVVTLSTIFGCAENQRGVLEQYLDSKGYSVIEPKTVNYVKGDKTNKTPSYIELIIKKK